MRTTLCTTVVLNSGCDQYLFPKSRDRGDPDSTDQETVEMVIVVDYIGRRHIR